MVLIKILTFSIRLFFFKLGLNILFDFVLEKKEGFLDYKNDIRKQSKNWNFFLKGLTYGFGQNFQIFSEFVFR